MEGGAGSASSTGAGGSGAGGGSGTPSSSRASARVSPMRAPAISASTAAYTMCATCSRPTSSKPASSGTCRTRIRSHSSSTR